METKIKTPQEIEASMKAAEARIANLRDEEKKLKGAIGKIEIGLRKGGDYATSIEGALDQQNLLLALTKLADVRKQLKFDTFLQECRAVNNRDAWRRLLLRAADENEGFRICTVCVLRRHKEAELANLRKEGTSLGATADLEKLITDLTAKDKKHKLETGQIVPCRELLSLGIPLTIPSDEKLPKWVNTKYVLDNGKTAVYFEAAQYGLGDPRNDGRVHAVFTALRDAWDRNNPEPLKKAEKTAKLANTVESKKEGSPESSAPEKFTKQEVKDCLRAAYGDFFHGIGEVADTVMAELARNVKFEVAIEAAIAALKDKDSSMKPDTSRQHAPRKVQVSKAVPKLKQKPKFVAPVVHDESIKGKLLVLGYGTPDTPKKVEIDPETEIRREMTLPDWMHDIRLNREFDRKKELKLLRNKVGQEKPESRDDLVARGIDFTLAEKTRLALGLPESTPVPVEQPIQVSEETPLELEATPSIAEDVPDNSPEMTQAPLVLAEQN